MAWLSQIPGQFSRREMYGQTQAVAWFYFTGKPYDDETGLYYYGARYYDPSLGRFLTPDTIVQAPDNPQTLNRYAYCGNNPVNRIDPSGHSWFEKFFGKILGTIAAIGSMMFGVDPGTAFAIFNIVDTAVSGGMAIASGAPPGRVLGAIGMSIGLNILIPCAPSSWGGLAQIGVNIVRGAAISVATSAAVWGGNGGDLGMAAAWGGGMAGLGTFLHLVSSPKAGGAQNNEADEIVEKVESGEVEKTAVVQKINDVNTSVEERVTMSEAFAKMEAGGFASMKDFSVTAANSAKGINWKTVGIGVGEIVGGITNVASAIAVSVSTGGMGTPLSAFQGYVGITTIGVGICDVMLGIYGHQPTYQLVGEALKGYPMGLRLYQLIPGGSN